MKKAISPIDGRDEKKADKLRKFFSEEGLIFFRVFVEIKWLLFLSQEKKIPLREIKGKEKKILNDIIDNFSIQDSDKIKKIEKITNHDVKAVEIFLREKLKKTSLKDAIEWIHFAATSEDINNIAWSLILKKSIQKVILPQINEVCRYICLCAQQWKSVAQLARTHGQPASPTTVGKEFLVFAKRLQRQIKQIQNQEFLAKFAGATGNFSAHFCAFENIDWINLSEKFIKSFTLNNNPVVTQIEPHDFIAEISHLFIRLNTILIDFSRDIWGLISFNFFKQKVIAGEVGSSTMPHKVNPIDFENAEGNLGIANTLFNYFAQKLPISRLQRDLSDSTVLRNLGVAFSHSFLAYQRLLKGICKLEINSQKIQTDLQNHPEILAEAVQTIMRAEGIENPYEKLKKFTRGKKISLNDFYKFVQKSELSNKSKNKLLKIKPENFTGLAEEIVERFNINP